MSVPAPAEDAGSGPIAPPARTGFQDRNGLVVVEKRGEDVLGHFDIRPEHLNRQGVVHGGVYSTMLDAMMASAGAHAEGATRHRPVMTISMTVNFTGRAESGRVALRSRVIARTRRSFTAEAHAIGPDGATLAHALGSFRYADAPPAPRAAGAA